MSAYNSFRNRNNEATRPTYPASDFSTGPDHHDPRRRLGFNDDPPNWDRMHEPIPLSMRAGLPEYVLKNDDLIFGPPEDRKPGVITYESKMGLPDGSVDMENLTDDELHRLIAEGLEPALPGITKTLPETGRKVDTAGGFRSVGDTLRKNLADTYPEGDLRTDDNSVRKEKPQHPVQKDVGKPYYTVHPRPNACEKCQAMASKKFAELPMYAHPNCKSEMREHRDGTYRVVEGRVWEPNHNSDSHSGIIAMGYVPESEYMRKTREQNEAVSRAMKGQGDPAEELDKAQETQKELFSDDIDKVLKDGADIVKEVNEMRSTIRK